MKKNIRLFKVILLLCIVQSATAVNYYWVGGSGNWSDINHWATTSGGAIKHGVVPGPSDDLFFNSSSNLPANTSFTVTVDVVANCHNMTWNGAPGTPLLTSSGFTLSIYGSSILQTGMNCTVSNINYLSPNAGETITSNNVHLTGIITKQGLGSYTFTDDFFTTNRFYLKQGGLNTNGKVFTAWSFESSPITLPTTATLTLGTSIVNISSSVGPGDPKGWQYAGTGAILSGSLSTINMTGGGLDYFAGENNHIYNNVNFTNAGSTGQLNGATNTTFNIVTYTGYGQFSGGSIKANRVIANSNLDIVGTNTFTYCSIGGNGNINGNNTYDTLIFSPTKVYTMQSGVTQTIRKVWTAITPVCSGLMEIKAGTVGSQSTFSFTAGSTATLTNVMLTNMKASGSLAPLPCTGFDMGNNTGFTITNPAVNNLYWIGGSGNWNDATHWSTTSGASYPSASGCIPTPIDNVFFDALSNQPSNTSFTTTISGAAGYCHNMTWSGAPAVPQLNSATTETLNIYGSSTLQTGMSCNVTNINYASASAGETITSNNVHLTGIITKQGLGSYTFTDDFFTTNRFYLKQGGLNTNGKVFTAWSFESSPITLPTTATLTLGTSTVNISSSVSPSDVKGWYYGGSGAVLSGSLSTINMTGGGLDYFAGENNHVYNNVNFTNAGSTGQLNGAINTTFNIVTYTGTGQFYGGSMQANRVIASTNLEIGGTNTFTYCSIGGNGNINGNNTYDTLIFSPTKVYTMQSGVTQTIRKVWSAITPVCSGLMEIKAGTVGSQSTFSFTAGSTATLTNVMLTNMKASGSLAPLPCTGFDMGNNTGFIITNPAANNLYWIGGSGNWNDATHWSTTSGASYPSASGCIPTPIDNVFFDALSNQPSNTSFTTTISGAAGYCHNMTWSGAPVSPLLTSSNIALNIYGSSILQTGMSCNVTNINYASASAGETITSNNVHLTGIITKQGLGSYTFADDFFTTNRFYLKQGGLNTNGKVFTAWSFESSPITLPTTATLTLGTSTVNISSSVSPSDVKGWYYGGSGAVLSGSLSTINMTGGGLDYFAGENNHIYNNVNFTNGGSLGQLNGGTNTTFNFVTYTGNGQFNGGSIKANRVIAGNNLDISGTNTFTYCSISGNGNINGANKMDTLVLSAGKTYVLQATQTQTVTSKLYASGNPCFLLILRSSVAGTRANLNVQGGSVNFDYGDIKDINASGLTLNYAGHTTDAGNNNNVTIAPAAGTGIVGLGPNTTLNCNQYPYTLNTIQFYPNPNTSFLWSDASTTNSLVVANPGTYSVSVMYGNGCVVKDTITLSIQVAQPITIVAANPVICSGNSTGLTASGMVTYTWSTGATSPSISVSPAASAIYTVTGTDVNSCNNTTTVSITVNITPTISIAGVSSTTICSGNNATITPSGAFTYTLMPGSLSGTSFTLSPAVSTTYSITGSSSANCPSQNTVSLAVQVNSIPSIATIQKQDVLCNGQNTGSLSFTVNGGTPGYNYSWSNTSDNVNTQDSLAAGSYTVIVTDAGSCFFTHTFSIIEPDSIHMDMVTSASCQNEPTGSAVISVSGGTPGYDIQWSNGQSGNTMTAVNVGAYTAVVTDNAGCAITGNVSILEKACVELFVPQIFTPNGDGKNDKFVVLKIEDFPNNAFSVFNRWGSLVYAKKNYQNEWNGKANVGDSVGDDTLPTGTYYVIIEFNDGHTKPYTGFVQLQL